jgi:hypothetical protein
MKLYKYKVISTVINVILLGISLAALQFLPMDANVHKSFEYLSLGLFTMAMSNFLELMSYSFVTSLSDDISKNGGVSAEWVSNNRKSAIKFVAITTLEIIFKIAGLSLITYSIFV